LVKYQKSAKLIQKNFDDATVDFNDEIDTVSNVQIDDWSCGGLSEDSRSIKWIEISFSFDTSLNIKKNWSEIEDYLRYNFYIELEIEKAKGYIIFYFADWEDNSVEQIEL